MSKLNPSAGWNVRLSQLCLLGAIIVFAPAIASAQSQPNFRSNWLFGDVESERPTQVRATSNFYRLSEGFDEVIRGQSPTFNTTPGGVAPGVPSGSPYFSDPGQGGIPAPPGGTYGAPIQPGGTYGAPMQPGYDPFIQQPGIAPQQFGTPQTFGGFYDINGPQPARLGWTTRWDSVFIAPADLAGGGDVSVTEFDWAADYTTQGPTGWLWKLGPEFGYRNYDFRGAGNPLVQPSAANDPGIEDNYYHLGYRFQATSPARGPLSFRMGFTPSINTDFQKQLNSQAWNFDVDLTAYYRVSPKFMWVGGVLYWDRAEDFILPHAGLVWNPNQFWEIRAVYPNPRADVFIGTPFGIATWLYIGAEYSVESYHAGQIAQTDPQLQVEEWRAFAGVRWEGCRISSYLDFGYAFDRKWNIHSGAGTSDLAPDDAFMIRYGVRY